MRTLNGLPIEKKKLVQLVPASYNPRAITDVQKSKLKQSIEHWGLVEPIVWNKQSGHVCGGHQRLDSLLALGIEETEVVVVDLPEAEEKALNLALNKISGEWDEVKLSELLVDLKGMDVDLALTGFSEKELAQLLKRNPQDGLTDPDEVPDAVETRCKTGDLWQLGEHRLLCGDSTKREDVARVMDGAKADMVFTDPPYGIDVVKAGMVGADFGVAKKGKYSKVISDDTTETARAAYSILKDVSSKQVIWGGNYFLDFLPFSAGWIVWDKRGDSGIRNTFADGELAWCSFRTPVRIYTQLWNGMIREGEHDKRVHPTQKPVNTVANILKDFSDASELVLDVFLGSGTTLIVCEQLGRKCYGMEIEPHYCDVILKRWEDFTGKTAVRVP